MLIDGIEIDVDIVCGDCNSELEASYNAVHGLIEADPCLTCIEAAKESGQEEGYAEGMKQGHEEGLEEGSSS